LPVLILESGLGYIGHFRKTVIIFTKYNHEIYFRSNYLDLLHVKGLISWWISSRIILSSVCVYMCVRVRAAHICKYRTAWSLNICNNAQALHVQGREHTTWVVAQRSVVSNAQKVLGCHKVPQQ
jgi:hypothetical protein